MGQHWIVDLDGTVQSPCPSLAPACAQIPL